MDYKQQRQNAKEGIHPGAFETVAKDHTKEFDAVCPSEEFFSAERRKDPLYIVWVPFDTPELWLSSAQMSDKPRRSGTIPVH